MDMESLPRFLAMARDSSSKWQDCFLHIKQTELFVEAKTAEQECLTEMPNVSTLHNLGLQLDSRVSD